MTTLTNNYATIGGRIVEYAETAEISGLRAAKKEIEETYGEETKYVYEGLKVYMKYGFDTYYSGTVN